MKKIITVIILILSFVSFSASASALKLDCQMPTRTTGDADYKNRVLTTLKDFALQVNLLSALINEKSDKFTSTRSDTSKTILATAFVSEAYSIINQSNNGNNVNFFGQKVNSANIAYYLYSENNNDDEIHIVPSSFLHIRERLLDLIDQATGLAAQFRD